ncbi:Uncharacterised protein [Citrobacter koseri]|uniref:Uncharacterized protein n=1 Tax=Citrobacter koseri TaxID=545 RepID=A0A2X2YUM6_CITKO|nr:Uncharacterised protein [Citrobacter koseri]
MIQKNIQSQTARATDTTVSRTVRMTARTGTGSRGDDSTPSNTFPTAWLKLSLACFFTGLRAEPAMQLCRQWAGGPVRQAAHHCLDHRIQPPTSSGRYNTDWMVRQEDLLYSALLGLNCRLLAMGWCIAGWYSIDGRVRPCQLD